MILRIAITLLLFCICVPARASCVAIIPAGAEHQFWMEVIRGASVAAMEEDIPTYIRAPNTETNSEAQKYIIEKALEVGCTGILLAPNSFDVLSQIPNLAASKTTVVFIDRDMGGTPVGIVKTNNYKAGVLAGREMIRKLGGHGRVALLRMHKDVSSTTERENGFFDTLKDSGVEIVHEQYIGAAVDEAREHTALLLKSGLKFDAIFTPNESTTVGALLSLKQLGMASKIRHIGFDFTPVLLHALRANEISGLVVQQPYKIGYLGVKTLVRAMNNEDHAPFIDVQEYFIDRDNIDDPEIRKIIASEYQ